MYTLQIFTEGHFAGTFFEHDTKVKFEVGKEYINSVCRYVVIYQGDDEAEGKMIRKKLEHGDMALISAEYDEEGTSKIERFITLHGSEEWADENPDVCACEYDCCGHWNGYYHFDAIIPTKPGEYDTIGIYTLTSSMNI